MSQYVYLIEQSDGECSNILTVETGETQAIETYQLYVRRAGEEKAKAYALKGDKEGTAWMVFDHTFDGISLRRVPRGTRRFEHIPEDGVSLGWWRIGMEYDDAYVYYDTETSIWKALYGTTISENSTDPS